MDWVGKSQAKNFYPRSIHTYRTSEKWHKPLSYSQRGCCLHILSIRFDLIVFIFWNMNGIWEMFDRKILIYFGRCCCCCWCCRWFFASKSFGTRPFIEPMLIMWLVCLWAQTISIIRIPMHDNESKNELFVGYWNVWYL